MRMNELIKTKRKEKNLTQQELADLLYLSSKTISKWETGRGLPELAMIPALSTALEILPEDLLSSIQDTTPSKEKAQDLGLNNALIIASALQGFGVLLLFLSTTSMVFLVLGLLFIISAVVTYFVMENQRLMKMGFQRNDNVNKYRRKIYVIWYILFMLIPISLVLRMLFTPGAYATLILVPMIIFPTLLFVLAYFVFIKK